MPVRTLTPEQYLENPRKRLDWLISGLIPRPTYMLLMGPPKAGKSFLAWMIAEAVATGTSFMGYKVPNPEKVLYLQLDTKEAAWTERLRNLKDAGVNLNIPNLHLVHQDDMLIPCLIAQPKGQAFIKDCINACDPALVILDVLREVHDEDENDSTVMKKVFDSMEPLFVGRSVLLVHHTRKMSDADISAPNPTNLARGSSYVTGRVDGTLLLYGEAPRRKLLVETRFQESLTTTAAQTADGLFSFPDLAPDPAMIAALKQFVIDETAKKTSRAAIVKGACAKWGISRASFYRLYGDHMRADIGVPSSSPSQS